MKVTLTQTQRDHMVALLEQTVWVKTLRLLETRQKGAFEFSRAQVVALTHLGKEAIKDEQRDGRSKSAINRLIETMADIVAHARKEKR